MVVSAVSLAEAGISTRVSAKAEILARAFAEAGVLPAGAFANSNSFSLLFLLPVVAGVSVTDLSLLS